MIKKLLITLIFLILISCNDRSTNLKSDESQNSGTIEEHKSNILETLLHSNQKQFSSIGNKSVIDSVNGFKTLFFGKSIEDLNVSREEELSKKGWSIFINNNNYSQVSVNIQENVIRMANAPVRYLLLEFYKKKLARITVNFTQYIKKEIIDPTVNINYFDFDNYELIKLCINSFGKPEIYAFRDKISFENAIEKLNGDDRFEASLQWQTNKIFYELKLEDHKKPYKLTDYKVREDYFVINSQITTYLKSSNDSLDYFKKYYEREFFKNNSEKDSIREINQRKSSMTEL